MKNIFLFSFLCLLSAKAFTRSHTDTFAYRMEREKINAMLEQRRQKFGLYDESLTKHTGIFGFQTKKDIRRSNDILTDIVKTDDSIYREIEILLEFRTFQQTQVQNRSKEIEDNTLGYMNTINKLRDELDRVKSVNSKKEIQHQKTQRFIVLLFVFMSLLILFLFARNSTRRA